MNGAPLESLNIPPPRVEKPKTPHRVNADKIKALRNEIIHLRNIIAQLSHRLSNRDQRPGGKNHVARQTINRK